ncbi:MAG: MscS Mechanosensitive ion channel [Candidatus Saccharibacteria bacterium GW2011_GWC2_48_9]|nr:MAG: MscS Mechanosensitive ion channel [Candidatus Saccharibacteria bacterium GW2011_GWC2_48_9]HCH35014.1 hypothetical protein [Candidatus Saccharibacteria bacterium]
MNLDFFIALLDNRLIHTALILLGALLVKRVSNMITDRIVRRAVKSHYHSTALEERKREDTISSVFGTLTGIIIWVVAIGAIASVFDINFTAIAASLGFLGVVIGLGAQTTIRDYVAGMFILIENQYRVGDIVTLSGGTTGQLGTSGVVEDITLRITKLRDLDGTLNIVRNGEASIITNRTYQYSSVVIDINVAYDSDIDKVEAVMNRVGKEMLDDQTLAPLISQPIEFLRVDTFGESGVIVKALGTVQPAEQWTIAGEYRRRILKAFKKEHIEIPLPQIVVRSIDQKTIKK